jgi:hypothetical protein
MPVGLRLLPVSPPPTHRTVFWNRTEVTKARDPESFHADAAAWTRFKDAGLPTKTEDNTTCCYALQDKVWVEDPDGNSWEVFVVKSDAPVMQTPMSKSGCCVPKVQDGATTKATGGCCG